ncbi:hypothetical protein LUZ60_001597 [Juncus effusus]|nr:hypothetical protein LUZ60_001597 [Juncus effusus]
MRKSQAPVGNLKGSGVVAVAIDNDKNSQHALKWAADHLLTRGQIFYLLHVRRKITSVPTPGEFFYLLIGCLFVWMNGFVLFAWEFDLILWCAAGYLPISDVGDDVAATFLEQSDHQTRELILPFQCFCSRRSVQCKEVILDEMDVPKAIVDFVQHRAIDKLVLGACSRSAIIRTFKQANVPTSVCKTAPDFCTIYVISKGKISSVRPAKRQNSTRNKSANPHHDLRSTGNTSFQSIKSDPYTRDRIDGTPRSSIDRSSMYEYDERISDKIKWLDASEDSGSFISCPSPTRTSTDHPPAVFTRRSGPLNSSGKRLNVVLSSSASHDNIRSFYEDAKQSFGSSGKDKTEDVEEELIRLRLELEQKREMSHEQDFEDAFNRYSRGSRHNSSESLPGVKERKPTPVPETREKRKLLEGFISETVYRRYSTDEMDQATEFFSEALKVGEGGYGPVYKSMLDHTLVAIKALRSDVSTTQGLKQFQQELEVLSKIRHPNMVLLLGACPEYGCLIYEYMSNGSLEDRLSCQSNTAPLPWQLRFKIASEIATGLLFLHQQRPEPLVHRDLKPANILLDSNLVAKIADVGLARLIPSPGGGEGMSQASMSIYRMTAAAGTFCYIDPEYQKTGMVGTKSDVYALGIIFLQLITGRAPMGLAHNVSNAIEEGKLSEFLDPNVTDWPMEETTRFAELALRCSELRRKDRPDLGSVVLPELRRLAVFAESKQDEEFMSQRQRCQSFKESAGMASFVETRTVKGSSFAI